MKTHNQFITTVLVTALGITTLTPLASAATETKLNGGTTDATQELITASDLKVSDTGRNVVMGVQYAKAALAQNQTDAAKAILADLTGLFGDQDGTVLMKTDGGYVLPLDTSLSVADGFTPTSTHEQAFTKAQALMAEGNIDEVVTTLNGAGVDLVANVAVLPYTATIASLKQAAADLNLDHLEQANLALDAITSSVHVATFSTNALPSQGYDLSNVLNG